MPKLNQRGWMLGQELQLINYPPDGEHVMLLLPCGWVEGYWVDWVPDGGYFSEAGDGDGFGFYDIYDNYIEHDAPLFWLPMPKLMARVAATNKELNNGC